MSDDRSVSTTDDGNDDMIQLPLTETLIQLADVCTYIYVGLLLSRHASGEERGVDSSTPCHHLVT